MKNKIYMILKPKNKMIWAYIKLNNLEIAKILIRKINQNNQNKILIIKILLIDLFNTMIWKQKIISNSWQQQLNLVFAKIDNPLH